MGTPVLDLAHSRSTHYCVQKNCPAIVYERKISIVESEQTAKTLGWPDTTVDRMAWEQAKAELGADADIHALIDRANKLKTQAKGGR